jgi:hypothetical protein
VSAAPSPRRIESAMPWSLATFSPRPPLQNLQSPPPQFVVLFGDVHASLICKSNKNAVLGDDRRSYIDELSNVFQVIVSRGLHMNWHQPPSLGYALKCPALCHGEAKRPWLEAETTGDPYRCSLHQSALNLGVT